MVSLGPDTGRFTGTVDTADTCIPLAASVKYRAVQIPDQWPFYQTFHSSVTC